MNNFPVMRLNPIISMIYIPKNVLKCMIYVLKIKIYIFKWEFAAKQF